MGNASPTLRANLAALRRVDPTLADAIERAAPAPLTWEASRAGPWTASMPLPESGRRVQLASRYDPAREAEKLLEPVDHTRHGGVVVLGLGLGHHVQRLLDRLRGDDGSLVLIYEPDLSLLRAVLEKIDHAQWLGRQGFALFAGPADELDVGAVLRRTEGFQSHLTQGTVIVSHPPTMNRRREACGTFSQLMTQALAFCRTHVATALVNSSRTYANLARNLGHYAAGPGSDELHRAAEGYPAVCVSAGPSLARNVDQLQDPAVRRRVVVITAQTTLKPLLQRGIRPDFVTALDYSPISSRFYEDLPELPDVTLFAEPLAHPTILDHFPGPIRVTKSRFLDQLAPELAVPRVGVPYGATVAHLSVYLAQHLGCDPIILIGQDLGFSDGLYYCPGTAIHDVWANELNAFNTLEMMEWRRVVRHRPHLSQTQDIHGRRIYTDQQMETYRQQFERDFAQATQMIIDATEGGAPKAHAQRLTLAEALARHADRAVPELPIPPRGFDENRLRAARDRIEQVLREVGELRSIGRQTTPILQRMKDHQQDARKMDRLFKKLERQKRAVASRQATFDLINEINSLGTFRRARADRRIHHAGSDGLERQAAQLDRDMDNVQIMIQACDEAETIFRDAKRTLERQLAENPRDDVADGGTAIGDAERDGGPEVGGSTDAGNSGGISAGVVGRACA